jgi:outer membrane biosynthesis protein TonB
MVRQNAGLDSLRLSRLEKSRLLMAFLVSLLVHLGAWGGYVAEKKNGWWSKVIRPLPHLHSQRVAPPVAPQMPPAVFLDVTEPAAEAPEHAKYYSDKNSRAANPDSAEISDQPKLAGRQKEVPKTEDVPRPVKADKPTPPATPAKPSAAQASPANTLMPGATEKAGPDKQAPERPRTLREALALQPKQLPGQQMQQEGGVRRRALKTSLDAVATPFGAYDRRIIEAIQSHWYDLLDKQKFALDRTGKVTVKFHLNSDGTVTELTITDNSVGQLLGYVCQESIAGAAPFGVWPSDMRRMVGATFREITFTFYYYND